VQKSPRPKNKKEVESFIGFTNYHRDHINKFSDLAEPLHRLTGPKSINCHLPVFSFRLYFWNLRNTLHRFIFYLEHIFPVLPHRPNRLGTPYMLTYCIDFSYGCLSDFQHRDQLRYLKRSRIYVHIRYGIRLHVSPCSTS
jgi:hypothetical protein